MRTRGRLSVPRLAPRAKLFFVVVPDGHIEQIAGMRRLLPALALGCAGCVTTPTERTVSKTQVAEPERTLSFERGGVEPPEDPTWRRAWGRDPMDLTQLGQQEGAARLIELAEGGGPTGAVALLALADAPDARVERARACELLADIRVEERQLVLRAVHHLLTDAAPLYEALAPGADVTCSAQLRGLLADPRTTAPERDLVESALEALGSAAAR